MRPFPEALRRSRPVCRRVSIAGCVAALLALCAQPTRAQQFDYDPDGFWKMPSPPAAKGEFGGEDPIGLASRQHIPTDCAIHLTDEAGKTYCFASSMSSKLFEDERRTILPKAAAFWAKEHAAKSDAPKAAQSGGTTSPATPPSR